jgi:hypothetical protein
VSIALTFKTHWLTEFFLQLKLVWSAEQIWANFILYDHNRPGVTSAHVEPLVEPIVNHNFKYHTMLLRSKKSLLSLIYLELCKMFGFRMGKNTPLTHVVAGRSISCTHHRVGVYAYCLYRVIYRVFAQLLPEGEGA